MEKKLPSLPIKLRWTEKRMPYVIFFCATLLAAASYMLFILVSTATVEQNSIFYGGPGSGDTFMDFFNVLKYISGRDPYHYTGHYSLAEKAYPPLAYLILYPFSRLFDYINNPPVAARGTQFGLMSVVFFIGVCAILLALLIFHHLDGNGISKSLTVFAMFLSGVFLFGIERANTIILAVVFLAAFLFLYRSPNKILREVSYLALAAAVGLKVYPVIFGILLLKEKRWWDAARTVLYGILLFYLPFLFFEGGFANISQFISNANENTIAYQFTSPIYRLGWLPFYLWKNPDPSAYDSWIFFGNVLIVLSVIFCVFLKPTWKAIALLTCALIATPVNSAYYCGIYFFPAIVLFLNAKKHHFTDWLYAIGFVLVLNPYQFIVEYNLITGRIANIALLSMYLLLLIEAFVKSSIWLYKRLSSRAIPKYSQEKVSD